MRVTLTPAYGRDYKSAKAALADFDAGKDFYINAFNIPTQYINKEQCIIEGYTVTLRYNNLTKTVNVTTW